MVASGSLIYVLLAMMNMVYSLRCPECIVSKWTNQTCKTRICRPSSAHRCLSLDAQVFEKTGNAGGETSHFQNKTCIKTKDCDEKTLCQRLKHYLWKKKEDMFVRNCEAKCGCPNDSECRDLETSTAPVNSSRGPHKMTSSPPATRTQLSPPKCFACERESLSTLCNKKPRGIQCDSGGFDSCFTLKAEIINETSGDPIEEGQWQDCAIWNRDCLANRKCDQLRTWLRSRGADWKVCDVKCCRGDYCNNFVPTPPRVGTEDAKETKSGAVALHLSGKAFNILFTGFVLAFS